MYNKLQEIDNLDTPFKVRNIGSRDEFPGCNWWRLTYRELSYSVYFDPSDLLGSVGEPYFELYDGVDTFRFIVNEIDELKNHLLDCKVKCDLLHETNPELFL